MKKLLCLPLILVVVFGIAVLQTRQPSHPVIKHFPLTQNPVFSSANTSVSHSDTGMEWSIDSLTTEPSYLRNDVSLLFHDGFLYGAINSWEQNASRIEKNIPLPSGGNGGQWEAISFHQAEIHYKDTIETDYIITGDTFPFKSEDLTSPPELKRTWEELKTYYNIREGTYYEAPLTDVERIKERLPSSMNEEIISRLWEGIYKEIVLPSLEDDTFRPSIPLILMDKKQTHLLVLFKAQNGRPFQLIQYYDGSSSSGSSLSASSL